MTYQYVRTTKTRKQIRAQVRNQVAPRGASSRVSMAVASAVAYSLFTDIHKGFMEKSDGGSDELGHSWPDLSPITKAYKKKVRKGDLPIGVGRIRGILTSAHDRIWRRVYSRLLNKLINFMSEAQAKSIAAGAAWNRVKALGARTKLEVLGGRKVPILIETHKLEKSLRPGSLTKHGYRRYNGDQIFRFRYRIMEIGTKVKYASHHDTLGPRPIFPDDLGIWFDRAVDKGADAMQRTLAEMLG